jgi:hypothetical protein
MRSVHYGDRRPLPPGLAIDLSTLTPPATVSRRPRAVPQDSFRMVLDSWPSLAGLAADLHEKYHAVYAWHRLDSIPRWHWEALLKSAQKFGIRDMSKARLEALDFMRHAPRKRRVAATRSRAA